MRLLLLLFASTAMAQTAPWPAARARHHMVYDSSGSRVLMFGGSSDSTLWSWDGKAWSARAGVIPPRANDAAGFDPVRGRIIMHGGHNGTGYVSETREWIGDATRAIPVPGPGVRGHHRFVYDPRARHLVLFGNNDDTPSVDTWGWNGTQWLPIGSAGPPARGVFAMAYDAKRQVMVMFGGCCAKGVRGDTWEFDGMRWTENTSAGGPPARYDTDMVFDASRGTMILFGGRSESGALGDTWEYDGKQWKQLEVTGPSAREAHAMVYDARAKAVLLFGGRQGRTALNDFWAFDGAWRQVR
jgi:hypothetical protein